MVLSDESILNDTTAAKRFWAKVSIGSPDVCWPWQACVGSAGYGNFRIGGKKGHIYQAHRVGYVLTNGAIGEDDLLHNCDEPLCCNPGHARPGTHQENVADMVQRGRNRTPRPGNGRRKLSLEQQLEIVEVFKAGKTNKSALARKYGVTPPRIFQILKQHGYI